MTPTIGFLLATDGELRVASGPRGPWFFELPGTALTRKRAKKIREAVCAVDATGRLVMPIVRDVIDVGRIRFEVFRRLIDAAARTP